MKITGIEIHPDGSSDVAVLSFKDPRNLNPYNVKAITGLDADTIGQRTIAIRIGLNPSYRTYSSLRDALYKTIAASRSGQVQLRFMDGTNAVAAISGSVSKMEATLFEKVPDVTLTIQCNEGIIRGLESVSMATSGVSLDNINISDLESTAPHGFKFQLGVLGDVSSITITALGDPTGDFTIARGFYANDEIYFSSETNNKYLYLKRGESIMHLGDAILPNSAWPIIFPGNNTFSFTNFVLLRIDSISYFRAYWGV
jgi:hypothetical protein